MKRVRAISLDMLNQSSVSGRGQTKIKMEVQAKNKKNTGMVQSMDLQQEAAMGATGSCNW